MDSQTLDKLNSIKNALEDLHNSQVAVVQKVAQLETKLMNSPDKQVEDDLVEVYASASDNADRLNDLLGKFNERVTKANKEYSPEPEDATGEE